MACVHHIVTDGWSMGIFLRELSALYTARARGKVARHWHHCLCSMRILLRGNARNWPGPGYRSCSISGERSWQICRCWTWSPIDRARRCPPSKGELSRCKSRRRWWCGFGDWHRNNGATLFMAVLAGFSVLLGRYSGQDEVVIGSPVAGRTRSETEGVIGFFVNTIVLRCDLRGNPCFRELLTRTRDRAVRAYAHQDLPFEKLVAELHPERDASRNPLHQVVLHLVDSSSGEVRAETAPHQPQVRTGTSPFDLVVHLRGAGAELKGDIEYSSELFDRSTVERLAEHLAMLLADVGGRSRCAAEPDPDAEHRMNGGNSKLSMAPLRRLRRTASSG